MKAVAVPYLRGLPDVICQQAITRPHVVRLVLNYLDKEGVSLVL